MATRFAAVMQSCLRAWPLEPAPAYRTQFYSRQFIGNVTVIFANRHINITLPLCVRVCARTVWKIHESKCRGGATVEGTKSPSTND